MVKTLSLKEIFGLPLGGAHICTKLSACDVNNSENNHKERRSQINSSCNQSMRKIL